MSALPSFSTIICNYNYERFVADAIGSALAQDYPADRFEVIVVDDGSTDGSRAEIARFAADARLKVALQENRGQTAAFEAGLRIATGDYVCLLDSDDTFAPRKLSRLARAIDDLGGPADRRFLCHDVTVQDISGAGNPDQSWFEWLGIDRLPDRLTLAQASHVFPFSNPCGIVMSRALMRECMAAIPPWIFDRGTDSVLCPAALILAGEVSYLREPLAQYRVHGANEVATIVGKRYTHRFDMRARTPRVLYFLERLSETATLEQERRAQARSYVRWLERYYRTAAPSRAVAAPLVSVAVLETGDAQARQATLDSVLGQTHARLEIIVDGSAEDPFAGTSVAPARQVFDEDRQASDFERLARAWRTARGEHVVFLRAGDRIDRDFVERHLQAHQFAALAGVTCTDVRLISGAGALLHADVFANSGAWKQPVQHIPPLATGLAIWVGAPLAACLFRRGELLDRFFSACTPMPPEVQACAGWLLFQLAQHTAGVLRLRETLVSVALPDGAAASYGYLSAPAALNGGLLNPPVREAAIWLQEFYLDNEDAFRRYLPEKWHRDFEPWLDRHTA